jgi:hypothetical protein
VKSCGEGCVRLRRDDDALQHLPASSILSLSLIRRLILRRLRRNCKGNQKSKEKGEGEPEHGPPQKTEEILPREYGRVKITVDYRI